MMFYDENFEYLEDPIRLFDIESGKPLSDKSDEEYDIKDIISIEDEGIEDISNRFDQNAFDKYIKSYIKDLTILPYKFREIKQNVELLDTCKPLSVEIIDCYTFPLYNLETSKIFYNKHLEKYIKSRVSENIDKFKEIMPNQYDDEEIDLINLNYNPSNDDSHDIDYVMDTKEITNIIKNEEKIDYKETDFQRNNKNDKLNQTLQHNKTNSGTNKLVPHYHIKDNRMFDEGNIRIYNTFENMNSIKNANNEKAQYIESGYKNMPRYKQNSNHTSKLFDQALNRVNNNILHSYNKPYNRNKVVTETLNHFKQTTPMASGKVKNYSKSNATADKNWAEQLKKINESIGERRNEYFGNSKRQKKSHERDHRPNSTPTSIPQDHLSQRVNIYSTEVGNSNFSCNNNRGEPLVKNMQSHGSVPHNICSLGNYNSNLYNNFRYTPYVSPITYYPNVYYKNFNSPEQFQSSVTRNHLSTRFNSGNEVANGKYSSLCNKEQITINNTTPLIDNNQTVSLVLNNDIPKIGGMNTSPINRSKLSEGDNIQIVTNINKSPNQVRLEENYVKNHFNLKTNNQLGNSASITETHNTAQGFNTNAMSTVKATCGAQSTLFKDSTLSNNNQRIIIIPGVGTTNVLHVIPSKRNVCPQLRIVPGLTSTTENQQPTSRQDMFVSNNNIKLKQSRKEEEIKEKKKRTTKSVDKSKYIIGAEKGDEKTSSKKSNTPGKKEAVIPNEKNVTQRGYSPPILPIPTYKKTFEILEQMNLTNKFKKRVDLDIEEAIHNLYNQEKKLSNRRFTHDLCSLSPNQDKTENQ